MAIMVGRDQGGRWQKGYCPNPSGRPKEVSELKQLKSECRLAAWERLYELLTKPAVSEKVRIEAVRIALNWLEKKPDSMSETGQSRLSKITDFLTGKSQPQESSESSEE